MDILIVALRAALAAGAGYLVIAALRAIRARSSAAATLIAAGILLRASIGLTLFWVSYLRLPIASSLQLGEGFWAVAPDAVGYFQLAAQAATAHAPIPLQVGWPAPVYLNLLALWMWLIGISPAAGLFLNLLLYVALMAAVVLFARPVNAARADLPLLVGLGAYSFSPVLLFHSTQTLKDETSAVLAAMACLAILGVSRLIDRPAGGRLPITLGTATLVVATFAAAGVRWYIGPIIWAALATVFAVGTLRGRRRQLVPYVAGVAGILALTGLAAIAGAGSQLTHIVDLDTGTGTVANVPAKLAAAVDVAREGFLGSGGRTNVIIPLPDSAPGRSPDRRRSGAVPGGEQPVAPVVGHSRSGAVPRLAMPPAPAIAPGTAQQAAQLAAEMEARVEARRAIPQTRSDRLRVAAVGLLLVFTPTAVVEALTDVEVPSGRGLIAVADLDTVFLDLTIAMMIVLLVQHRASWQARLPVVLFAFVLSGITALLLGYVVTNFGTLWRMRLLVEVPLWIVGLALAGAGAVRREAPITAA